MPLKVNFALPWTKTRKRLDDPYQTDAEIYGLTDPTQALGRAARSGVETALGAQIPKLNFDPVAERTARTSLIERSAQQEREKLGRQFALTPGGTTTAGLQGGEQQRPFELLSSNVLNLKDTLESELSQRTGTESRANAAALQGIQGGIETSALNAGQLNLSAVQQGLQAQGQGFTQGLQEGELTGDYGGKDTLAKTEQAFRQKATTAGFTGMFDNAATQQAQNDKLSRAIATGQQTGTFTDPDTNIVYSTQAALEQAFRQGATSAGLTGTMPLLNKDGTPSIDPATGQQRMGTTLEAQRLGLETAQTFGKSGPIASGSQTLAGMGQAADILFRAGAATGNIPLVKPDGSPMLNADGSQKYGTSLEQQQLYGGEFGGGDSFTTASGEKVELAGKKSGTLRDGTPFDVLSNGVVVNSKTGQPIGNITTGEIVWKGTLDGLNSAIDRAAKQGAATGTYTDPKTGLPSTTLDAEKLRLEREGVYGGVAPVVFNQSQLQVAIGSKTGDPDYVAGFDVDGDGTITNSDASTVAQQSTTNPDGSFSYKPAGSRTLAGQTADTQTGLAKSTQRLEEEKTYGGVTVKNADGTTTFHPTADFQLRTAEQKQNYQRLALEFKAQRDSASQTWAQITGITAGKPGTMSASDFQQAMADSAAGRGFDPSADFNEDGKVDEQDALFDAERANPADKAIVPDDQAPIPTLEAKKVQASIQQGARSLGITEKSLTDNLALNRDQFNQGVAEFKSNFGGALVDVNGGLSQTWKKYDPAEQTSKVADLNKAIQANSDTALVDYNKGDYSKVAQYDATRKQLETQRDYVQKWGGEYVQPTALERQQFDENTRQYNKNLDVSLEQFAAKMGLEKSKMTNDQWGDLALIFANTMSAVYAANASRGSTNTGGGTASGPGGQYGPPTGTGKTGPSFGINFNISSDRNIKHSIRKIPHGLNMRAVMKSDKMAKHGFKNITHEQILRKIASMPVSTWKYNGEDTTHIGPMAQDFKKAFKVGDSDKHIHVVDAIGVNLSAVKALDKKVRRLEKRVG